MKTDQRLDKARQIWNKEAATFDNEPDHGLNNLKVRAAWTELLLQHLPSSPLSILDIGCGTGSLSVVLASLGHHIVAIDIAEEMIHQAQLKATKYGYSISFAVMDAYNPNFPARHFDAIICRHLLWAMPEPSIALERWAKFLRSGGKILLIEGYWHTGAGLKANQVLSTIPSSFTNTQVQHLSQNESLWGSKMNDERYIVTADYQPS